MTTNTTLTTHFRSRITDLLNELFGINVAERIIFEEKFVNHRAPSILTVKVGSFEVYSSYDQITQYKTPIEAYELCIMHLDNLKPRHHDRSL